jgi:hypothetical protein
MERDYHESPTRPQERNRVFQHLLQRNQLVVHRDPERLEGSRGGMNRLPSSPTNRMLH